MSLRIFSLKFLLFSLILILIIGIVASEPLYCTKVDFNRPTFSEFIKCKNKFVPLFVIENYVNNSSIQPYRPTSEYFLSANAEGFTCAESTATFFLNSSSRIDAAIFLSFKNPGAFVEILVFDADRDIPVYSWKNDSSNGWYTIWGKIGITIKNARVRNWRLVRIRIFLMKNIQFCLFYFNKTIDQSLGEILTYRSLEVHSRKPGEDRELLFEFYQPQSLRDQIRSKGPFH